MRRRSAVLLAVILLAVLSACTPQTPPEETTLPIFTTPEGEVLTGWQTIGSNRYCFDQEGRPLTGWATDGVSRYYLNDSGMALTGWQELEGKRFYFGTDGAMTVGWTQLDGSTYYFGIDGSLFTGLLNIGGKGYYFSDTGRMYSGWLELDGKTYYFGENGEMAVGQVEIDGMIHHFSPRGVKILLVNPWNKLPADYEVELTTLPDQHRIAAHCADALNRMLSDCHLAGHTLLMVSAYRTHADQEYLFNRKVESCLKLGMTQAEAEAEAARNVAVPDTSEHQLGLAVDLVDINYPYLDDHQAETEAQKWLMEHCHEYGFILRYPVGSTEITGIVYEPWHYRYVGQEIAQEIMNLGITLEEYLGVA